MSLIKYLAYGSNLHPQRLRERVPSCEILETVNITGYLLKFHKRSHDGSGKCNIHHTGNQNDYVPGVIYEISATEKVLLDQYEGVGNGYDVVEIDILGSECLHNVFAYIANPSHIDDSLQPYDWYRDLVLQGSLYHDMPEWHINFIRDTSTVKDPDEKRQREHLNLLNRLDKTST
jgi:hypothetical protein